MKKNVVKLGVLLFLFCLSLQANATKLDFDRLMKLKWHKGESQNFTVYSDLKPREIKKMLEILEDFSTFSRLIFKVPKKSRNSKITMFAAAQSKTWKSLGQNPAIAARTSSLENGKILTLIYTGSSFNASSSNKSSIRVNLFTTIAQTQIRFAQNYDVFPLWYRDGMTRYLATYQRKGDKVIFGKLDSILPRLKTIINATKKIEALDIKEVLSRKVKPKLSDFKGKSEYIHQMNEIYSINLLLVHYFNADNQRAMELDNFFRLLKAGHNHEKAMQDATGMSIDELGVALYRYISNKMYARSFDYNEINSAIKTIQGSSFKKPVVKKINAIEAIGVYEAIPIERRTNHLSDKVNQKFSNQVKKALAPEAFDVGS